MSNNMSGFHGLINIFAKEVGDASKITFIGSPGMCTPFAELMACGVQDKETHFSPLMNIDDAHQFEPRSYGLALGEEVSDPHDSDIVVILGGVSMPEFNVDVNELNDFVDQILNDDGKIIGVCFMDMFTEAGWLDKVNFDCVIDGTLISMVKR